MASDTACRKAYLAKIAACHPDKGGSAASFHEVQTAYESYLHACEFGDIIPKSLRASKPEESESMFCGMSQDEYRAWKLQTALQAYQSGLAFVTSGKHVFRSVSSLIDEISYI